MKVFGANTVHAGHCFAGGPHVMGIVNVTPDSFSDGGKFLHIDKAIAHGLQMISDGAYILDIGGESTRPGAEIIDPQEEIQRIRPVLEGLRGRVKWLSVDTRNAATMEAALAAGANCINDISALRHDPRSASVVAEAGVPIFLMHMQGTPQTMQKNPIYINALDDIFNFFKERIQFCEVNRIDKNKVIIDPGIGFGKTLEQNLVLHSNIKKFCDLGVPVMLGSSRKSFIEKIDPGAAPDDRIGGSLASVLWCYAEGVRIFRVHDVKETVQALKIYQAIANVI